jgi:hypothetical protein
MRQFGKAGGGLERGGGNFQLGDYIFCAALPYAASRKIAVADR